MTRSVKLVAELNALGAAPLVVTRTGGERGGPAALTAPGEQVIALDDVLNGALREGARRPIAELERALGRG